MTGFRFFAETITREDIADISYAVQRVEHHVNDQPECKQPGHARDYNTTYAAIAG